MAATAYGSIPDGAAIRIEFLGNTELNVRLRTVFQEELQKRGYRLSDNGNFLLRFETLVEEKLSADKPATIVGRGGSESGAEVNIQFRRPLKKLKPVVGGRRYSLNVTVAKSSQAPV